MKKFLALVLAFAMVFTSIPVVFADTEVSAEAKALALLGMLEGDGGGVTVEYTSKELTRLGAAAALLKLKGLYDEAIAFQGEDNFADVKDYAWVEGRNLMAYLKANPALGFGGDEKGNFNPGAMINEQSYYKVLLETLGYKQTTAEVAGDFAWEEVFEFAEKVGLKPAKAEKFTIDELAKATFAALNAKTKDGKVYVDTLIAAGVVTEELAVAAGVKEEAPAVAVEVDSVKAIGNGVVEVIFKDAVDKAAAENLDNYSIEGLEITNAVLDGTKKVLLYTSAQTAGAKYTLVVGDAKFNFGGIAKSTAAAELEKVEGTDTNRVKLTFTKVLDLSALDVEHYAIPGVTIVAAKWADSTRKVVELETEGLVANKTYKVTVTDIKTIDLVNLKSASKSFLAKSDTKAPKASINKDRSTNTRIIVTFDEEVTAASAEDLNNYALYVGSTDNQLEITGAKLVADANDKMTVVELTTAPQKVGTKYVLHISNIVDRSVLANAMTKTQKLDYYGKRVDDGKPTVLGVDYLTNKLIEVRFSDASRLDFATLLDVNNYEVNNDVVVEKVELEEDDADCKTVILTVSELGEKSSYKITIKNVADEYGNVMNEKVFTKTFKESLVNTPATVQKVVATKTTEVKVYFTKKVESVSAKDVANYTINGDIGTPVKAAINSDKDVVTLTTGTLVAGKEYTLTINGVKDLAGNEISNVKVKFVGVADGNDVEAPEIDEIEAVNKDVVRVYFTEVIDVTTPPTISIDVNGDGNEDIEGTYKVSTDDDDMVLEFKLDSSFTVEDDVVLLSTTAADKAGNVCEDKDIVFASVVEDPEKPELVSWEQTTVKEFKLIYSEKIDKSVNNPVINAGANVPYSLTVTVDKDDNTIVYLRSNQVMGTGKIFKLDLSSILKNYHGVEVEEDTEGTVLETTLEDEDAPYIVDVKAVDKNTVKVTFNEELRTAGTYKITYTDENDKEKTVTINSYELDKDVVTIKLSTALNAKYVYTLSIGPTRAQDLANNKVDADSQFDFVGTNVEPVGNYITGVEMVNGQKINVKTFDYVADGVAVAVYEDAETDVDLTSAISVAYNASNSKTKKITVTLNDTTVFKEGASYYVLVGTMRYDFKGIVEADIDVEFVDAATDYYQLTYGDVAVGDKIYANGVLKATVTSEEEGARILASELTPGTYDILVKRGTVPVYFAEDLIEVVADND